MSDFKVGQIVEWDANSIMISSILGRLKGKSPIFCRLKNTWVGIVLDLDGTEKVFWQIQSFDDNRLYQVYEHSLSPIEDPELEALLALKYLGDC